LKDEDPAIPKRFQKYRPLRLLQHIDFQPKEDNISFFDEYNWEEHAYGILKKYIPSIADCLHQESEYAF
jgi:hypothetical protein